MEAYVNGVWTRKVDRLVERLGVQGMSKDRVSRMCRGLDERVDDLAPVSWSPDVHAQEVDELQAA